MCECKNYMLGNRNSRMHTFSEYAYSAHVHIPPMSMAEWVACIGTFPPGKNTAVTVRLPSMATAAQ